MRHLHTSSQLATVMDPFPYHVLSFGSDANNQNCGDQGGNQGGIPNVQITEPSGMADMLHQMNVSMGPHYTNVLQPGLQPGLQLSHQPSHVLPHTQAHQSQVTHYSGSHHMQQQQHHRQHQQQHQQQLPPISLPPICLSRGTISAAVGPAISQQRSSPIFSGMTRAMRPVMDIAVGSVHPTAREIVRSTISSPTSGSAVGPMVCSGIVSRSLQRFATGPPSLGRDSSFESVTSDETNPDESSFTNRSTKGASKQRRDLINGEIGNLRDMLPLSEASRQRLSQLQIMSLACCYIRKCNYFGRLFGNSGFEFDPTFEFAQTMTGFLVITTKDGKLLYISENVTQFLGHSMVDMLTQGDSLYDIIDKKDHGVVRTQLQAESDAERTFFCKMNVSRSFRRQSGFGDSKVMHVRGHFIMSNIPDQYGNQPVFMALCSPLITPDVKEGMIQHNTMIYQSVHSLDMKFIELANNGEFHIGFNDVEIQGKSWYDLIHPDDLYEAKDKHVQLLKSSHEMGCMLTIRIQHKNGSWVWINMVMHIRQPFITDNTDPAIVCINHAISEAEAQHFKMQSQLYSSHIARSPEFLNSPSGSSPSHTITQVAMEGTQSSNQSFSTDEGNPMYYHAAINMAPITTMSEAAPAEGSVSIIHSDITTLQQDPFQTDGQKEKNVISRADIMSRLKRKMAEYKDCKPAKIARVAVTNAHQNNDNSIGTLADSLMSNTQEGSLFGFDMDVQSGPTQMVTAAPVRFPTTVVKKNVATVLGPQGISITHQPLTPMSPAQSITSESSELYSSNMEMDTTVVPPSVLTPDLTPINSPEASVEYISLFNELGDSLSMFQDETVQKIKPAQKPVEKKKVKVLPQLDVNGLEMFLNGVASPASSVAEDDLGVTVKTEVPSPMSSVDSQVGSPYSVASELADMENGRLETISPEILTSLMCSVGNALRSRRSAEDMTQISGDFMLVPDQSPSYDNQNANNMENTNEESLLDLQGLTPSYGDEVLQSAMFNQTL